MLLYSVMFSLTFWGNQHTAEHIIPTFALNQLVYGGFRWNCLSPILFYKTTWEVVSHDVSRRKYSYLASFLAEQTLQAGRLFVATLCYGSIVYWAVNIGQSTVPNFSLWIFMLFHFAVYVDSLGFLLVNMAGWVGGINAAPALLFLLSIFDGWMLFEPLVPVYWRWLVTITPDRLYTEAILEFMYGDELFSCADTQTATTCPLLGREGLKLLNYDGNRAAELAWIMFGLIMVLKVLAYVIRYRRLRAVVIPVSTVPNS